MKQADDMESFRDQVYLIVQQVPRGHVTTYGQVASFIPPPAGVDPLQYERIRARWVGRAMRHAPEGVPWHRVINSQGRVSLPPGSRSGSIQRIRLEAEGITFNRNGAIDLGHFQWKGPDPQWAKEHGLLSTKNEPELTPIQLELLPRREDNQTGSHS
jgi:methylated-DNA-protein-cysteine methyltransferase-like protein